MITANRKKIYRGNVWKAALWVAVTCAGLGGCERKQEPLPEKSSSPTQAPGASLDSASQKPVPKPESGLESILKIITLGQLPDSVLEGLEVAGEENPKAVAEWAATLPLGSNRDTCLELVFKKWGEMDAPAAIDFVRKNLQGMDRTIAAASIAEAMALESPESATAALGLVTEPIPRGVVVRSVVTSAFETDPSRAASWVLAQSSAVEREVALMALTELWSQREPQACAAWVVSVLKGDDKTTAASELIESWGRLSPRDAAQWLEAQKAGVDFELVGPVLAESWSIVDPKAAATWASQEKNPEMRSELVEVVVSNWVLNEAGNSIDWASGIQDGELKKSVLESAFTTLGLESPGALDEWIKSHPGHPAIHDAEEVQAGME